MHCIEGGPAGPPFLLRQLQRADGNVSFSQFGTDAYGSIAVGGGVYSFGAIGLTVAQMQAAIYYY